MKTTIPSLRKQRGFTLIELMVALTIGLFLALAVTSLIAITINQQKTSAGVNDRDQTVAISTAQFDRNIRSAGSGISNSWDLGYFGCVLRAAKSNTAVIPSALAAPFDSVAQLNAPVVAPLIVEQGVGANGSDVIFAMSGNGASGLVPRYLRSISSTTLNLDNVIGFKANDLMLVAATGMSDCYVTQISDVSTAVAPAVATTVTLGGTYYAATVTGASQTLDQLVGTSAAYGAPLGNSVSSRPMIKLFGVGASDTLFEMDMLQLEETAPRAIADGVSHLFVLYGVDTNQDGKLDAWVNPSGAEWGAAAVKASAQKISQIVAVRIAMITHTRGSRQTDASPATITAFASLDASLQHEVTLTSAQRTDRYKLIETVIPLRNNLMLN